MGLKQAAFLALGAVASASNTRRQTTTKYCPGNTEICFSEFQVPTHDVIYRIAIPDVAAAPFDVLLQIVAPVSKAGWAGIAWGGKMATNPLTVAWPNGDTAAVSSRWSTGRNVPGAYAGATYTVLPSTKTNETHWQLDVLCRGCSEWAGGSLDPNGVNTLAWAKNTRGVNTATSNTSSFGIHDGRGAWSHDFTQAKIPKGVFDAVAYDLENSPAATSSAVASPSISASASSTLSTAVVSTSVVVLPRPSTTSTSVVVISSTASSSTTRASSSTSSTTPAGPQTTYVFITTRVSQIPPRPTTPSPTIVTVTVTVRPTPTATQVTPPWGGGGGGGGPPWGKGKGGGGGGGGGGGWGKGWGRRRIAAEPVEQED
ncbi:hypothetical protein QBC40DRAFT_73364 [Triangularia verruculosa]|uniref:Cellobiose dehydrogenase-like cytochrome domain-containing protein n=1 Tax=Triangularia verruculosa TaxID=2587418 RepID=A0AAN6XGC4_9PEZI|nr:hypothetical protein QBC40DRAFT_73364 [Triangularia verruculosa]